MDITHLTDAQVDDLVVAIVKELYKRQHYIKCLDRFSTEELKHLCFCILTDQSGAKVVFDAIKPAFQDALEETLHPNDWIKMMQHLETQAEQMKAQIDQMKPKPRNQERDNEVLRLKKEKPHRTAGQIAKLVSGTHPEWAVMENGKPLNAGAVRSILSRKPN